jgi:hypothetical protein
MAGLLLAAPAASAPTPAAGPAVSAPGSGAPRGVTVASAELIAGAADWDGRVVAFAGEAIGEPMVRGDGAWLQLNDDDYRERGPRGADRRHRGYNSGQAIWAPAELARRVRLFGGYRRQGDGVRVTGTFHAACREHGGDMDIHAASLEIVREGHAVTHRLNTRRLGIGLALLALAGALELARRRAGPRRS